MQDPFNKPYEQPKTGTIGPHISRLIVFLLAVIAFGIYQINDSSQLLKPTQEDLLAAEFDRVVDGDTIIVFADGNRERVRLIGIDAPESVNDNPDRITREGIISSAYLEDLMKSFTGQVWLEFDVEDRDKFGRMLAYVWLDDELLNLKLCREGFAWARSYPPNTSKDNVLKSATDEAKSEKLGIWGDLSLQEEKFGIK